MSTRQHVRAGAAPPMPQDDDPSASATSHYLNHFPYHQRTIMHVGGQWNEDKSALAGAAYVERLEPPIKRKGSYPIVLIHGDHHTGSVFLTKPDNSPGWAHVFLSLGYTVYIPDLPFSGRSMPPAMQVEKVLRLSPEKAEQDLTAPEKFDHPEWPGRLTHTQWPGTGLRGTPEFDHYYQATQPVFLDRKERQNTSQTALAHLLIKSGPAVLIGHGMGANLAYLAADMVPDYVKGIAAVEPIGPPFSVAYDDTSDGHKNDFRLIKGVRQYGICDVPLRFDPPPEDPAFEDYLMPEESVFQPIPIKKVVFEPDSDGKRRSCWLQDVGRLLKSRHTVPMPHAWPDAVADEVHEVELRNPLRTLPRLRKIPQAVMTAEASAHRLYDWATVEFFKQCGVENVRHVRLEQFGIRGNGHLCFLEKNSTDIANLIHAWIECDVMPPSQLEQLAGKPSGAAKPSIDKPSTGHTQVVRADDSVPVLAHQSLRPTPQMPDSQIGIQADTSKSAIKPDVAQTELSQLRESNLTIADGQAGIDQGKNTARCPTKGPANRARPAPSQGYQDRDHHIACRTSSEGAPTAPSAPGLGKVGTSHACVDAGPRVNARGNEVSAMPSVHYARNAQALAASPQYSTAGQAAKVHSQGSVCEILSAPTSNRPVASLSVQPWTLAQVPCPSHAEETRTAVSSRQVGPTPLPARSKTSPIPQNYPNVPVPGNNHAQLGGVAGRRPGNTVSNAGHARSISHAGITANWPFSCESSMPTTNHVVPVATPTAMQPAWAPARPTLPMPGPILPTQAALPRERAQEWPQERPMPTESATANWNLASGLGIVGVSLGEQQRPTIEAAGGMSLPGGAIPQTTPQDSSIEVRPDPVTDTVPAGPAWEHPAAAGAVRSMVSPQTNNMHGNTATVAFQTPTRNWPSVSDDATCGLSHLSTLQHTPDTPTPLPRPAGKPITSGTSGSRGKRGSRGGARGGGAGRAGAGHVAADVAIPTGVQGQSDAVSQPPQPAVGTPGDPGAGDTGASGGSGRQGSRGTRGKGSAKGPAKGAGRGAAGGAASGRGRPRAKKVTASATPIAGDAAPAPGPEETVASVASVAGKTGGETTGSKRKRKSSPVKTGNEADATPGTTNTGSEAQPKVQKGSGTSPKGAKEPPVPSQQVDSIAKGAE